MTQKHKIKKVLIIKTSSLGDVIHTLAALSDAKTALGNIEFDWVVEENFAEIPAWHPAVNKVIPVAIRRWRKNILKTFLANKETGEWQQFKRNIQLQHYDAVIDAQGLIKSALLTRLADGETYGLDKSSAREPLASYFYQHPQTVSKQLHAVERVRELFAKSLAYNISGLALDYGIAKKLVTQAAQTQQTIVGKTTIEKRNAENRTTDKNSKSILFLHGTTWDTKHWPETYWYDLGNQLTNQGHHIIIPWGNDLEHQRALNIKKINKHSQQVRILEKMSLNELVLEILRVDAVVAVDTGLAHLSAALDKPTIAIYGPTSPGLTGTYGKNQHHLKANIQCSPCFKKNCSKIKNNINPECYTEITPEKVLLDLKLYI